MAEPFVWGSGGSKDTADRRRRIAEAMMRSGSDSTPVQHWTQGANRVAQAILGAMQLRDADAAEKAGQSSASAKIAELMHPGAASAPASAASAQPGSGDPQNALDAIMKFESGGRNVHQNIVPAGGGFNPSTGTVTGPSSAQGYFQMITPTWLSAAKMAGVDTSQYPTAMSAPYELQRKAAAALYGKEGFKPWAPYNASLRAYIAKNGGAGAFTNDGFGATRVADLPAAGAAPVAMETGQDGFAIPPAPQPAMTESTFNAIANGVDSQPLDPVFKSEGLSQPWMGSAIMPAPPEPIVAQAAPVPLPPPRPIDLAMPQADQPAPGAVPAIGQVTPAHPAPIIADPTRDDAGARQGLVASEEARLGLPSGAGIMSPSGGAAANAPVASNGTIFDRIASALGGGAQPAQTATPSAGIQRVAAAAPSQSSSPPSAGAARVAAAMDVLNNPYANTAQRSIAQAIVSQALTPKEQWTETTLGDGSVAQRNSVTGEVKVIRPGMDPLDRQSKELDLKSKQKALDKPEPPVTREIELGDGTKTTQQWDAEGKKWITPPSSVAPASPRNPYAPTGKATEEQAKSGGFANRMVEGHDIISRLEETGTSKWEAAKGWVPVISNSIASNDKQMLVQAQRNFVNSILRRESGASISPAEFENAERQYFPVPGDGPDVIAQKRANRETAIKGVMASAGPGYTPPKGFGQATPKAPSGVDPKVWQHMTPEERALWN